jgi:DUF971 family protein
MDDTLFHGCDMAGLDSDTPIPVRIVAHQSSRVLELEYADGRVFRLPFEFLRVWSPSAEVRGHGPGQEVLQTGKADIGIASIESIGHYAIQPQFTDGHASGIYSWDYLYSLCENQESMWQEYLERLEAAGASRHAEPPAGAAQAGHGAGPGLESPAPVDDAPIDARSVSRPR